MLIFPLVFLSHFCPSVVLWIFVLVKGFFVWKFLSCYSSGRGGGGVPSFFAPIQFAPHLRKSLFIPGSPKRVREYGKWQARVITSRGWRCVTLLIDMGGRGWERKTSSDDRDRNKSYQSTVVVAGWESRRWRKKRCSTAWSPADHPSFLL